MFSIVYDAGDLDANRPVPFRLTPNILEYLSTIGVSGPLTASMIAAARCLVQPSFKVQTILRAILRDEMIAGHRKVRTEHTCALYYETLRCTLAVDTYSAECESCGLRG
jgi:transformation/transcription domain-associated protein